MADERKMSNDEKLVERARAYARKHGLDLEIGIIPDEDLPKGPIRLTFFGEARRIPEVDEPVEVRVEDGSWRKGYRAISKPTTDEEYPGEEVIWITPENEWRAAKKEGREPDGAPWPVSQMALVD